MVDSVKNSKYLFINYTMKYEVLHGFVESSKVSLSEKITQENASQFGSRGSEGFSLWF